MDIRIDTPVQMQERGKQFAEKANKIIIHGELGAGKTTLAKGLAEGRGFDPVSVQSPTYTYLHIYDDRILHIDMRRLETEEQFLQLGVFDLIDQYDYVVIEWPKRTELYLDSERKTLAIRKEDDYRILTVSYST